VVAIAALLLVTAFEKFTFRSAAPLWIDEVWTGMIASQRSVAGLVRQCYLDVNAPLNYILAWLWAGPSGLSNAALRAPSGFFASLAPIVALIPSLAMDRRLRLIWCGLLACWLPGILFAAEARCYTLVLLLAVANTAAFARALRTPTLAFILLWTTLSSLLILAHYVAGALVACQGLAFLAIHRTKALRTWPAALALLPAAACLAVHAQLLAHFASPGVAFVAQSHRLADVGGMGAFLWGGEPGLAIILVWLAICLMVQRLAKPSPQVAEETVEAQAWVVPGAAVAAIVLCVTISVWRPVIVTRYLTAMVPGVLLGLAMIARRFSRSWRMAPAALIAVQAGLAVGLAWSATGTLQLFSFQEASDALMHAGAQRLVFLWDDSAARGGDHDAFGQIGGFFFMRAGRPIPVDAIFVGADEDPNPVLLAHAKGSGAAILWLYDTSRAGTAAIRFPPALTKLDPSLRCRDFGDGVQRVLACVRSPPHEL
jgi:hypothetical protein